MSPCVEIIIEARKTPNSQYTNTHDQTQVDFLMHWHLQRPDYRHRNSCQCDVQEGAVTYDDHEH